MVVFFFTGQLHIAIFVASSTVLFPLYLTHRFTLAYADSGP